MRIHEEDDDKKTRLQQQQQKGPSASCAKNKGLKKYFRTTLAFYGIHDSKLIFYVLVLVRLCFSVDGGGVPARIST
jgi:hypothetical protein